MASLLARARKRLTGTGAGPDGPPVRPPGEPERERPAADAGEQVDGAEPSEVPGVEVGDGLAHDFPVGDEPFPHELSKPSASCRVVVIVEGSHECAAGPLC